MTPEQFRVIAIVLALTNVVTVLFTIAVLNDHMRMTQASKLVIDLLTGNKPDFGKESMKNYMMTMSKVHKFIIRIKSGENYEQELELLRRSLSK